MRAIFLFEHHTVDREAMTQRTRLEDSEKFERICKGAFSSKCYLRRDKTRPQITQTPNRMIILLCARTHSKGVTNNSILT